MARKARGGRLAAIMATVGLLGAMVTAAGEATDRAALEGELRAAEIAFAASMADRDPEAFSRFLDEEAVFFGAAGQHRGRQAVTEAWAKYFEGAAAPFSWEPDVVAVLDSGRLGLTSGPVRDPGGNRIGTFNSVWRRDAHGNWKVVFDRGCPPCPDR